LIATDLLGCIHENFPFHNFTLPQQRLDPVVLSNISVYVIAAFFYHTLNVEESWFMVCEGMSCCWLYSWVDNYISHTVVKHISIVGCVVSHMVLCEFALQEMGV